MKPNLLTLILPWIFPFVLFAQSGPGGIRTLNECRFWFDPINLPTTDNTPLSSWTNSGGNGLPMHQSIASLRPLVKSGPANLINGFPVVRFDGSNDQLIIDNNPDLNSGTTPKSGFTFFIIFRTGSDVLTRQLLYEQGGSGRGMNIYIVNNRLYVAGWNLNGSDGPDSPWGFFFGNASIVPNTTYIVTYVFSGNSLKTGSIRGYLNGNLFFNQSGVGQLYPHLNAIGIGLQNSRSYYEPPIGSPPGNIFPFKGDIIEFIHYNISVSEADRIIVENYLSGKFNLTINNGYYVHGLTHKNDIVGIGKASNGSSHTLSISSMLSIENPSDLDNDEFLFIGHDGNGLTVSNNIPAGVTERLERVWRVSEHNEIGTTLMRADLSGYTGLLPTDPNDLVILVDDDGDFSNATVAATAVQLIGSEVLFVDVDLNNNDYFTIGLWREITWDGTQWQNGSGPAQAPNTMDGNRRMHILGPNAIISNDATVRSMIVYSGSDITIASSKELTVNNEIINNGSVTVLNNAGLTQTHEGANQNSGSGNYYIHRTGLSNALGYNSWCSPVSNAGIFSTFGSINPCDVYVFEPSTQKWKYDWPLGFNTTCLGNSVTFNANHVIPGGDGVMDLARGYFIPGSASSTRLFSGSVNNGTISIGIVSTNLGNQPLWDGDDWNLVGNPYPGALNAQEFFAENAVKGRIYGAIYFWDDDNSGGAGYDTTDYASWNLTGGTSSPNSPKIPTGFIASGQGFWVAAATTTNLIFNNSMRGGDNSMFFKNNPDDESKSLVWINAMTPTNNGNQILIGFTPNATRGVDAMYDGRKLSGNRTIAFGSELEGFPYVIQAQDPLQIEETREIGLILRTEATGVHYFEIDRKQNMGQEMSITIVDTETGKSQDLDDGPFAVYLAGHFTYNGRFKLVFYKKFDANNTDDENGGLATSINTTDEDKLKLSVYPNDGQLYIRSQNHDLKSMTIFDVNGRLILERDLDGKSAVISIQGLTAGIYLCTFSTESGLKETRKLAIP